MKHNLKTKAIIARSLMAVMGIILGIFIVAQIKTLPTRNVVSPVRPIASLKETREILYSEQSSLKSEIESLQAKLDDQRIENNKSLSANELQILKYKKAQAGFTRLSGQGVAITLDDSKSGPTANESIVHAADLRDIINLLWGSTAEAISINDERIVSSTAIDCIVNTILINNTRISNPFVIKAIGDKTVMAQRLNDKSILTDLHNRKSTGLIFKIEHSSQVIVPAFSGVSNTMSGEH